jgi:hypothetical protein
VCVCVCVCVCVKNCMELSSTREVTGYGATQELPNILWNSKVHYRAHKSSALYLSRGKPIQSVPPHPISQRSSSIIFTHLRFVFLVVSFHQAFPPIKFTHSTSLHSWYIFHPCHPPWLYRSNYIRRRV